MNLASFLPEDVTEPAQTVGHSLDHTKTHPSLLRSFFEHAEIKP
jgi:hypothetical protein